MGEPICDIPEAARCLGCDYALRGLTELRCPECGRAFNPHDRRTMNLGRQMGSVARWWLRPAGRPLAYTAIVPNLMLLIAASAPGWYVYLTLCAALLWLAVAIVWLIRFFVSLGVALYYRQPTFRQWGTWRRWAIAPGIAAVAFSLLALDVPLYTAFWISRPAMDRLAKQVRTYPQNAPKSTWVGVYYATDIETISEGMRFLVAGTEFGLLPGWGFAWSSDREPDPDWGEYHHMVGAWYRWTLDW